MPVRTNSVTGMCPHQLRLFDKSMGTSRGDCETTKLARARKYLQAWGLKRPKERHGYHPPLGLRSATRSGGPITWWSSSFWRWELQTLADTRSIDVPYRLAGWAKAAKKHRLYPVLCRVEILDVAFPVRFLPQLIAGRVPFGVRAQP